MAKIALEYMDLMDIKNTQFILVRHHNIRIVIWYIIVSTTMVK